MAASESGAKTAAVVVAFIVCGFIVVAAVAVAVTFGVLWQREKTDQTTSNATTTAATTEGSSSAPVSADPIVFIFLLNYTYTTPNTKVPLPYESTNPGTPGRYSNSEFVTTKEGLHYIEICAAVVPSTASRVKIAGVFLPAGYEWASTDHNGNDGGCRAVVMYLTAGVRLTLHLVSGSLYSDNINKPVSLAVFSISDSMTPWAASSTLFATTNLPSDTTTSSSPIPFTNPYVNPSVPNTYNPTTQQYRCTRTGPYFFSVSVGVPASKAATVQLTGPGLQPTIQRSAGQYNGVTTHARNFLLECVAGTDVQVVLRNGELATGPAAYNLISLTAFPYAPRTSTPVAWAVYRSTMVNATSEEVDPITFDNININLGSPYGTNGVVTIPTTGYYYVYFTAGTQPGSQTVMSFKLVAGGQTLTLYSLSRTSTRATEVETQDLGAIMHLQAGFQLKLAVPLGNVLYSDTDYQTSFFGMLLYST